MSEKNKSQQFMDVNYLLSCINNFVKTYVSSANISETANILIDEMIRLGLHYGHDPRSRKDNAPVYNVKTKIRLDVFDRKSIYDSLLLWSFMICKALKSKQLITIIHRQQFSSANLFKYFNIFYIKRWMPGTITNSTHVLQSYNKKYGIQVNKRPSFIISSVPKLQVLLAKEISKTNISLLSIVDSDVSVKKGKNIYLFYLNDESPYFVSFVDSFISSFINRISLIN